MTKVFVLHENAAWVVPLRAAFDELRVPFEEWFLDSGTVDLGAAPPAGVFYNRMSASAHSRGHRYAPEHTATVLAWLEAHGRTVVNGWRAVQLEISKAAQYAALARFGIPTPRTVAVTGRTRIAAAATAFAQALGGAPIILKPNRGGKGLGVRLFRDAAEIATYVESDGFEPSLDGTMLLQEYVRGPQPHITRCEFVGGEFLYAVRVDTSEGFELCPADACRIDDASCPVGEAATAPLFEIVEGFRHPLLDRYRAFLKANHIAIAGIELVTDAAGEAYTYDVNTNTNYNPEAEAVAGRSGMRAIARHLGALLAREGAHRPVALAAVR
jgi:predicted ATP-grasp superfamily ATP-dependent carboligase